MKISHTAKGYFLAFVSVIAVSNVYIFSKAALKEVSLPQFGVYWFAFGLLWIVLYKLFRGSFAHLRKLSVRQYGILVFLGIIEVLSTYFFFKAIYTISNPAIVSFIGNISPALIITLSFFVLKETFNKLEFLGMLLALFGAFIISYKGGSLDQVFIDGAQYIVYSGLFGAINAVIIKIHIQKIPPQIFTLSRTTFLLIFSIIALWYMGLDLKISISAFKNIFVGSILGPFLTVIAGYLALQYIPLSRKAIIGSTRGVFVLIGAYLYFGNFPGTITLIGGFISIIGVLLIGIGKLKK